MDEKNNSFWFAGENKIQCEFTKLVSPVIKIGKFYVGVIELMPGMSSVELIDEGSDSVIIKTNEGLMKRSNITLIIEKGKVIIDLDEEYQAGKMLTTRAHFQSLFTVQESDINHRLIISDLQSPGFLGFFNKKFANDRMGKAFLHAHKKYMERQS
jgi:hypothetical protein